MNNPTSPQKVTTFITDIQSVNPDHADIIHQVSALFMAADAQLEQDIKYGGLVFLQNGTLIGGLFAYKKHVSIEFSKGATFSDPAAHLEGGGKHRRHLKIHTTTDITTRDALSFIKQAVA